MLLELVLVAAVVVVVFKHYNCFQFGGNWVVKVVEVLVVMVDNSSGNIMLEAYTPLAVVVVDLNILLIVVVMVDLESWLLDMKLDQNKVALQKQLEEKFHIIVEELFILSEALEHFQ